MIRLQELTDTHDVLECKLKLKKHQDTLSHSEDIICNFFLKIISDSFPEVILDSFKELFFKQNCPDCLETCHALYKILGLNQEATFKNVLVRSCYILINNWAAKRQYSSIHDLIDLFSQLPQPSQMTSGMQQRCWQWLMKFRNSQEYHELKVFSSRYSLNSQVRLSQRYASYLLASQSRNPNKTPEQRQAAEKLSQQLKEQFKFDLAMYTAQSQSSSRSQPLRSNPTQLRDNVLDLMQKVIVTKGKFSYIHLANIFLKQTQGLSYYELKQSLLKYLFYSFGNSSWIVPVKKGIAAKLTTLYEDYDEEPWDHHLCLRSCNRIIDYLTTENRKEPSFLLTLMMMQEQSLSLVIILLKLILISRNSYSHLEGRIANLIEYYDQQSEVDCQWLIDFLEALQVTLTIYSDGVSYNLVKVKGGFPPNESHFSEHTYRVFSLSKADAI